MPRDGNGIYNLPPGYVAVTGQTIQPSQHNPPLEDIAQALTLSLPRNGAAPMTGALNMGAQNIDNANDVEVDGDLSVAGAANFTGSVNFDAAQTIPSAATVDLGGATSNTVTISGTTTITSFGTAAAGVERWVRFSGALTLTHNATSLILPGGTNILTAAGDTLHVKSEGSGNWRVYSYQQAISNPFIPAGAMMPYGGTAAPSGWLLGYGQPVSRTTYAALFAAIGTTYGVGDGSTTFNVPDLRGRVVAGKDDMGGMSANRLTNQSGGLNGDTLGATGGAETHTLTSAEMPAHRHFAVADVSDTSNTGTLDSTLQMKRSSGGGDEYHRYLLFGTSTDATISRTSSTGSGGAHNNVQPTIILNYIVKY